MRFELGELEPLGQLERLPAEAESLVLLAGERRWRAETASTRAFSADAGAAATHRAPRRSPMGGSQILWHRRCRAARRENAAGLAGLFRGCRPRSYASRASSSAELTALVSARWSARARREEQLGSRVIVGGQSVSASR